MSELSGTIENSLPEPLFNKLVELCTHIDLPWHYSSIYNETDNTTKYHWSHVLVKGENDLARTVESCIDMLLDKANINLERIRRVRFSLLTQTDETKIHEPYTSYNEPHCTGLLYINTSNANTYFYKEKYDLNYEEGSQRYLKDVLCCNLNDSFVVKPEKNKFVWFDGTIYHSISSPTDTDRQIILEFDFIVKE